MVLGRMLGFIAACKADFRTRIPLVLWLSLTVLFGLSGPFGTYMAFELLPRFGLWLVLVGLGVFGGAAVRAFVYGALGITRPIPLTLIIACIMTMAMTPFIFFVIKPLIAQTLPEFPALHEVAGFVFAMGLVVGAFRHTVEAVMARMTSERTPEVQPERQPVRLMDRLPCELAGDLISISVRDHYVDVQTDAGQASLLMRLSDAIAETGPIDGAQVHRSHWVAWHAVTGVQRKGTKTVLMLHNGTEVPVGKSHREKLVERGLL